MELVFLLLFFNNFNVLILEVKKNILIYFFKRKLLKTLYITILNTAEIGWQLKGSIYWYICGPWKLNPFASLKGTGLDSFNLRLSCVLVESNPCDCTCHLIHIWRYRVRKGCLVLSHFSSIATKRKTPTSRQRSHWLEGCTDQAIATCLLAMLHGHL